MENVIVAAPPQLFELHPHEVKLILVHKITL